MTTWSSSTFVEAIHELLSDGNAVRFRASGHSMHPTIKDGDKITVEPLKGAAIKRGDIILYRSKHGMIAHRVVRVDLMSCEPHLIMRGDALTSFDLPIASQQALGRVVLVERGGFSTKPRGRRGRLIRAARLYASNIKARLQRRYS